MYLYEVPGIRTYMYMYIVHSTSTWCVLEYALYYLILTTYFWHNVVLCTMYICTCLYEVVRICTTRYYYVPRMYLYDI